MVKRDSEFWLENPLILMSDMDDDSLTGKLNRLTRIVLFVSLVLYLGEYKHSTTFLLVCLSVIVLIQYMMNNKIENKNNISNNKMGLKENFNYKLNQQPREFNDINYVKERLQFTKQSNRELSKPLEVAPYSYYSKQIQEPFTIDPNEFYQSKNQALVGKANPKTNIPPILVPTLYDPQYWRANDFVTPSYINSRSTQDYYASGYQTLDDRDSSTSVSGGDYNYNYNNVKNNGLNNGYEKMRECTIPKQPFVYQGNEFTINPSDFKGGNDGISVKDNFGPKLKENYTPLLSQMGPNQQNSYNTQQTNDMVNPTSFHSQNVNYNLPVNYTATPEEFSTPSLNDQIFTSTVTPGIYYKNDIVEPLNSNIGISWTQQIPPTVASSVKGGTLLTAVDPDLTNGPKYQTLDRPIGLAENEVYDPRSYGYGSAVRGYIDEMSGQPRYFYDDVNAIRQPNYINRSNIDFLKNVDTYGPMNPDNEIIQNNKNARENVENAYLENQLKYRSDIMTSLLRKQDAQLWQRRLAPINRTNQFTRGGGRITSSNRGNLAV